MNWLFFALLAPSLYTLVTFVDKYIVEKEVKDYKAVPIYGAIAGLLLGSFFWVINDFPILTLKDSLLTMLGGSLMIWGTIAYLKALTQELTSTVNILMQMIPIMVLLMSYIFLKEQITPVQLLGFLLIFSSSIIMSLKKEKKKFKISRSFFLILIFDFFIASSYIIFSLVSENNSFFELISYESWGLFTGGLLAFIFSSQIRNAFLKSLKKLPKRAIGFVFLNEAFFITAKLCTFLAISLGSVALVSVLEGTQVFLALIYGFILTLIAPKIFKEEITSSGLSKKFVLAILVFAGIYLIQ